MARTQLCQQVDGTKIRVFRASSVMYNAASVPVLGVGPVADANKKEPVYDTGELMRAGILTRISVTCNNGVNKPPITYRLFCDVENIGVALNHFNSSAQTLNGKTVIRASLERRQVIK
ncbi:MAG: hypothetical protein KFF72_08605 [Arthrospira sp. SH-MAG29]|nr:hypothetical protein [Arthrospira sp. SH-MAG29]MBS0016406.1 hypothetical protein [Arthrospira sp. SH-MAG29]